MSQPKIEHRCRTCNAPVVINWWGGVQQPCGHNGIIERVAAAPVIQPQSQWSYYS